jgi:hypothetical protein
MQLQDKAITPHVAQNTGGRRSAIDDRITRHPDYAISQRIRKRVEEAFGWAKTSPACARCGIAGCSRSIGNSPSQWPPTTSSGCANSSPRLPHEPAHISRVTPARSPPNSMCCKTAPANCSTDRCGTQTPLKSAFFQLHPSWFLIFDLKAFARASGRSRFSVQTRNIGVSCSLVSNEQEGVPCLELSHGSAVVDRIPGPLCDGRRVCGGPFRASLAAGVCLPGLRRGPSLAAEDQSLHLRVRRLRSSDLGECRHDHACPASCR